MVEFLFFPMKFSGRSISKRSKNKMLDQIKIVDLLFME